MFGSELIPSSERFLFFPGTENKDISFSSWSICIFVICYEIHPKSEPVFQADKKNTPNTFMLMESGVIKNNVARGSPGVPGRKKLSDSALERLLILFAIHRTHPDVYSQFFSAGPP